jgi:hypothetical protein
MAMATLLQGYAGSSDAETVELTVVDLRWQMVLDVLGTVKPAFSQGAFQEFRQRLIKTDMDRRILQRTAEVARETGAYDPRKLPKDSACGDGLESNRGCRPGRGHDRCKTAHVTPAMAFGVHCVQPVDDVLRCAGAEVRARTRYQTAIAPPQKVRIELPA